MAWDGEQESLSHVWGAGVPCQVLKGAYDGIKLRSTEQAILSDTETLDSVGRALPIEILPSGEFQPLYRTTLNVQVRPLSISLLLVWFLLGYPFGATLIASDSCLPAPVFIVQGW